MSMLHAIYAICSERVGNAGDQSGRLGISLKNFILCIQQLKLLCMLHLDRAQNYVWDLKKKKI